MSIRNPIEWGLSQLHLANLAMSSTGDAMRRAQKVHPTITEVRRIGVADIRIALRKGVEDFGAYRSDVIFLCVIYPIAGLVLGRIAFGYGLLPLAFPLASGFALIGPFAAIGLYEMSRRRETHADAGWPDAMRVIRSPSFGSITALGLMLVAIFLVWLLVAWMIYDSTLGSDYTTSAGTFARNVLTTSEGHVMIVVGCGVGFLFALLVLAIGTFSFPLLLDRDVPVDTAVATSIRAIMRNPGPMALWGLIVALGLAIGSLPALLGLVFVMPVLGHATWHLYRRMIVR